jgi:hypothetical protein
MRDLLRVGWWETETLARANDSVRLGEDLVGAPGSRSAQNAKNPLRSQTANAALRMPEQQAAGNHRHGDKRCALAKLSCV